MSLIVRGAMIATLLLSITMLASVARSVDSEVGNAASIVSTVHAAPAQMATDGLTFSADVDGQAKAVDPQIDFSGSTERVWTSFSYRDYGGESMSFLVRANGEDWRWGDLDCCENASGQFAFPIERRGGNLGGAAYDVMIYASNAEVGHAGFGVRGTRGFDDSDDNDND